MKTLVTTKTITAVLAATLLLASALAHAEGDLARGEKLAYTCLGCHGVAGYRNAYPSYRVPKLGGQKAAYLIVALNGYRAGTRAHRTMAAQASSLSDQQIEDIAAYLASLASATVEAGGVSGASLKAAQPCVACHGQNGISLSPTWPTLAGQHEDYLVQALMQYRSGIRTDVIMAEFVSSLSDAEVELLAQYYANLEGLETTAID